MRKVVVAVVIAFGLVGGTAHGLSEWWVPGGKSCPTFDTEEACKNYCRADQDKCGGEVACSWKTGAERPMC